MKGRLLEFCETYVPSSSRLPTSRVTVAVDLSLGEECEGRDPSGRGISICVIGAGWYARHPDPDTDPGRPDLTLTLNPTPN